MYTYIYFFHIGWEERGSEKKSGTQLNADSSIYLGIANNYDL